jgi:putative ABC transport system permease protein
VARFGGKWARIIRPDARSEVEEELAFHLERRVADYMARGMDEASARAAAEARLGDLRQVRSECTTLLAGERREEARKAWMKMSWLDFKLGMRMLVRYPGLTVVGGLAMAFAIWIGAGAFEVIRQTAYPVLPLDEGDRVVGIVTQDVAASRAERRVVHDYETWRTELRTLQDVGAYRLLARNLIAPDGSAEPVDVAEMTSSGFRVARVAPLLGRTLVEADEAPGAASVAVIGYDVWQRRFNADPDIIGRTVHLGRTPTTVVGVMPEEFGFPVSQRFWVPFRIDAAEHERGAGPGIGVFARLADGATLEQAQAEVTTLARRAAAAFPQTNEHLQPEVLPFARSIINLSGTESLLVFSTNIFLVLLLMLMCANVALLMFARAATRESEIVVRSALGASRGRIVTQLFAEALVLGSLASLIGLAAAGAGLRWGLGIAEAELLNGTRVPFWIRDSLGATTILYAILLTLLGAAIAGVLPALKITRGLQARLRETAAGGGGLRFGGVWTAVIITQVAVTVAFPAVAYFVRRDAVQIETEDVGFQAGRYLSARFEIDRDWTGHETPDEFAARFERAFTDLRARIEADPAVAGMTFGERLPRMYHPHRLIELDEGPAAPLHPAWPAYRVSSADVEPLFFDVLDVPIDAGRAFTLADVEADAAVVIVNRSFVNRVMGGRSPIGRRIRYTHFEEDNSTVTAENPGPWLEIIGVVRDLGLAVGQTHDPKQAGIYHPTRIRDTYPAHVVIHVNGEAAGFAPRLRALAAQADPSLRLYEAVPMDDLSLTEIQFYDFWFRLLAAVSVIALLLSLAGIYAAMSFAVSRRTREIGIRVALGCDRRSIVLAIFRRPLIQVTAGVLAGAGLVLFFDVGMETGMVSGGALLSTAAYALVMFAVCMLACIVPTRRALTVQPTEALRAD